MSAEADPPSGPGGGHSLMIFCGQPLASTPISQRIAAFGAHVANHGWRIRLTSVDPRFEATPFPSRDAHTGLDVEIIGKTHYGFTPDGRRYQLSPLAYLRECRAIARRIRATARSFGADCILLSTTLPASLYAAATLRSNPIPVGMDVDDWSAGQFAARGGAKLVGNVYAVLESVLPKFARDITVCSRELQHVYPGSTWIPNFIRLSEIPARVPSSVREGRVRVAFASSVTAYHGHVQFLQALARRRTECSPLEVHVLGDGDALDECRAIVAEGGLSDVVRFGGRLNRGEMLQRLAESDIGVLPLWDNRLNRARFPLKLLDYLACGCAVAASDVGMAREILKPGETGMLSEPGNMDALIENILQLANDTGLRNRMAARGQQLAQEYDEARVCGKWMTLMAGWLRR